MLINFSEQIVNNFLVPSFTLKQGEIVIIELPSGPYFRIIELETIKILTSKAPNENTQIISPLKYVEDFEESRFRYHFYPTTVEVYLNKYANESNPIYKEMYNIELITPKAKVKTLSWHMRRLLSLYATLSWTNNIIFDLVGIDPKGGQHLYEIVKKNTQAGGAAILFDFYDEFENDCTTFIKVKYLGE